MPTLKEKAAALLAATEPQKITFEIVAEAPVSTEDRAAIRALSEYAFSHGMRFATSEDAEGMWVTVTISEG